MRVHLTATGRYQSTTALHPSFCTEKVFSSHTMDQIFEKQENRYSTFSTNEKLHILSSTSLESINVRHPTFLLQAKIIDAELDLMALN